MIFYLTRNTTGIIPNQNPRACKGLTHTNNPQVGVQLHSQAERNNLPVVEVIPISTLEGYS